MALYNEWRNTTKDKSGRKEYWRLVEKAGGRDAIRASLAETVRSHYDRLEALDADRADLPRLSNEALRGSLWAPAVLETGVPRFMMSMLIRAGLPSRRAAMAAIENTEPRLRHAG